jgi:hypothetical protein
MRSYELWKEVVVPVDRESGLGAENGLLFLSLEVDDLVSASAT